MTEKERRKAERRNQSRLAALNDQRNGRRRGGRGWVAFVVILLSAVIVIGLAGAAFLMSLKMM